MVSLLLAVTRQTLAGRASVEPVDIDELVSELRQRVAIRRASGDYPVGLEEQLEAEFKHIMAAVHRDELNTQELGRRVQSVERATGAIDAHVESDSRLPGGSAVHKTAGRLVSRHTGQLAHGVRVLGIDIARALHEIHHLIEVQKSADERQLVEVIGALMDRVAVVDHLADAILDLERRVLQLEQSRPSAT
jgi:hypothetical protein